MTERDDDANGEQVSDGSEDRDGGAAKTDGGLDQRIDDGATPGQVGAADGFAAAGSAGAVSSDHHEGDAVVPTGPPDPTVGPD